MGIRSTVILSPEQISLFREQGFLGIPQITTAEEVIWVRDLFTRLFANKVGRAEGAQFDLVNHDDDDTPPALPQIINPVNFAPELRKTLFRVNALAIAKQLLGSAATPAFEHAILKPPLRGAATPWHQDEAFRVDPNFDYQQVSLWMPLQEATVENGCMQYIPGSNKGEVLAHQSPGSDSKVHALECIEGFDPANAVPCPLPAGGAVMHAGRTLHFAGPNRTAAPRGAYVLAFEVPPRPSTQTRDFYWNRDKQAANQARRRAWRRKGGILIEMGRKLRGGVWRSPGRVVFEMRRVLHSLKGK